MAIPFLSPVDFNQNQLLKAVLERSATAPTSPAEGRVYYNTANKSLNLFDGTQWIELGTSDINLIEGTSPIGVEIVGGTATISIQAAGSEPPQDGYMSSAHYAIVAGATDSNDPSAVVRRDATGNFAAGIITADLTGTASNATQLDNQDPSYYLDRTNHTGTQTASTISDFDTQVDTHTLDALAAPVAAVDMNGQVLSGLGAPTQPNDAVRLTDLSTLTVGDADLLDGQDGSYYLDRTNHTGTQTSSTISDLETTVKAYTLDSFAAPAADVSLNSNQITNLGAPSADTDAATKLYVDETCAAIKQGFDYKDSVRAASTAAVTISAPGATVGGVTMAAGNRVLLMGQTPASANGLYVWNGAAVAMTRTTDADNTPGSEVTNGLFVYVEEGTYANSQWVLTTPDPIVLGTTNLTFSQFSGAALVVAGSALSKTGETLDVNVDGVTIIVNGSDALEVTSVPVALLDGIVPIANGGTGADNTQDARVNLEVPTMQSYDLNAMGWTAYDTDTRFEFEDATLNHLYAHMSIFRNSDGCQVFVENYVDYTNSKLVVIFGATITPADYRVVVTYMQYESEL